MTNSMTNQFKDGAEYTAINLDWSQIDTVFLDMDGTLLDLHFDNHFWLEHLPRRYAEEKQVSAAVADRVVSEHCRQIEGTLNWYCLDYWESHLDLDLVALKREVADKIAIREHVEDFLHWLGQNNKRRVLLTNAHEKSVDLKFEHVAIAGFFDRVITSHSLGIAKEREGFWEKLQKHEEFAKERVLFVDDNLHVLRNAQAYGVANLLAIHQPDSRLPPKAREEFVAIESYRQIMSASH